MRGVTHNDVHVIREHGLREDVHSPTLGGVQHRVRHNSYVGLPHLRDAPPRVPRDVRVESARLVP